MSRDQSVGSTTEPTALEEDVEAPMHIGPDARHDLVHRYYRAYDESDRAAMQAVLHPGFTFTSPLDDRIDVAHYFARCWPGHEQIERFVLLDVAAGPDDAIVRYEAMGYDGSTFSNVERFEFAEDLILHIDVFFGQLPGA
jgi:hypothetical protein